MAKPTPHSLLPEADAFVLVALGVVSALERFEGWLARPSDGDAPSLDPDDPVLLAALGLVSLHRTAARWLATADSPPAARAGSPPMIAGLLR